MKPRKDRSWHGDWFATSEILGQWALWLIPLVIVGLLAGALVPLFARFQQARHDQLVVYVAQDQVFAEPLLREFESVTGLKVRAVYDSEAVKTVGLANRLLAERRRPRCDVFWGNEELRTRQLAAQGVWRETNGWAAFGYRSRRIVINTNFVSPPVSGSAPVAGADQEPRAKNNGSRTTDPEPRTPNRERLSAPQSLLELTNSVWRGRVALAYPLFGTTATHFLALRQHWGAERWEAWCRALAANQPLVVDGNSVVAKLVAKGEAWGGLTDSDDIAAVQREGAPVLALPLSPESLLIPNTVAVVRGARHAEGAEALFRWLQRPEVAARLVQVHALEGASAESLGTPTLKPDWEALLTNLEPGTAQLKEVFLR